MSFNNFMAGLLTVTNSDTDLNAWAQSHFTKSFTQKKGFRPIEVIGADEYPLQSFYLFDGESGVATLGGHSFDQDVVVIMELIWTEPDPAAAFEQAETLIDGVPRAINRNRTLNNAVASCDVTGWQAGDPLQHPIHMISFKVAAEYNVLTA